MRKIGIITIHYGVNHGSFLQSYALSSFLKNKGYSVDIINYVPKRYGLWHILREKKRPFLVSLGYLPFLFIKTFKNRHLFKSYCKRYLPLTKKYNKKSLARTEFDYQVYMVGSDQVWNDDYNGGDEFSYFFDFIQNGIKIAYAASFGKNYPLSEAILPSYKEQLSNFGFISVRESDGLRILQQMGLNGYHVCDPTLLLPKEQWLQFSQKKKIHGKYLLIYVMDNAYTELLNFAETIAKRANLCIYVISFSTIRDKRIDKLYIHCTPKDFINLFACSSFVVTNSFHGTVFSTIFEKRMLVIGKDRYNSRMKSFLEKNNLLSRFVEKDSTLTDDYVNYLIDGEFEQYKNKLDEWISYSERLLILALEKYCCK